MFYLLRHGGREHLFSTEETAFAWLAFLEEFAGGPGSVTKLQLDAPPPFFSYADLHDFTRRYRAPPDPPAEALVRSALRCGDLEAAMDRLLCTEPEDLCKRARTRLWLRRGLRRARVQDASSSASPS